MQAQTPADINTQDMNISLVHALVHSSTPLLIKGGNIVVRCV